MQGTVRMIRRVATVLTAVSIGVSACQTTPNPSPSPSAPPPQATTPPAPTASADPRAGGTLYLLTDRQLGQVDPQRIYGFEDLAFFNSTIFRSLLSYRASPDPHEGTTLVPDLATDIGRPSDGGRTWEFTLRDGVAFEGGDAITCADVRYGVSRTFATDVISGGPTYAIELLDIPANPVKDQFDARSKFPTAYYGPYDGTGQDLFEEAVECSADGRTITFHLNKPVADFNRVTTLGFSPVPIGRDTRGSYGLAGQPPAASGPYLVDANISSGTGGQLVLVRNPSWDPATDPVRPAFPDRWVVEYGVEPRELDERLIAAAGEDAYAMLSGELQSSNRPVVFEDSETPRSDFATRVTAGPSPFVDYLWIDVQRVPNPKHRQAITVALNRAALRNFHGGAFYGSYADGLISPSIGDDYAPTDLWSSFFGEPIPDEGAPGLANQLMNESGEAQRTFFFKTQDTPNGKTLGEIVQRSLAVAGINVRVRARAEATGDFGLFGWAADWPSASSVIPPLLTRRGGWDLSNVDDPAFNAAVDAALATADDADRTEAWRDLNRQAVERGWVVPTFFKRSYAIAGTKVGPIYRWPAYNSWPYAEMRVLP